MHKNIVSSLIIGILLSSAALYPAFRNIPFADLGAYLRSINYLWIIPSIGVSLFTFILRVLRWQIILDSSRHVPFWRAFHPLMIGFMINSILPGRAGEVARPVILKKQEQVPFSTGLATVVAERVFDSGLLILLFLPLLAFIHIDPDFSMAYAGHRLDRHTLEVIALGMVQLSILLVLGIAGISIPAGRRIIQRLIRLIPRLFFFSGQTFKQKIGLRIVAPLVAITENIASGFALVKSPRKMVACLVLSFLIWWMSVLSFYLMAFGSPGIRLSFLEMATVLIIICFFIAIPSVPGYWGIWEAGGIFALSLFGISIKEAAGFTLANHAIQMIPVIIVGLISALLTGINIVQVSYDKAAKANNQ